jgi:hypothetical protein
MNRIDYATLDFAFAPGDQEVGRRGCRSCGVPVARVRRNGQRLVINQDGSVHARTCAHVYSVRRRSLLRDPAP